MVLVPLGNAHVLGQPQLNRVRSVWRQGEVSRDGVHGMDAAPLG